MILERKFITKKVEKIELRVVTTLNETFNTQRLNSNSNLKRPTAQSVNFFRKRPYDLLPRLLLAKNRELFLLFFTVKNINCLTYLLKSLKKLENLKLIKV